MGAAQSTTNVKQEEATPVSLCEKQLRAIDLNARTGNRIAGGGSHDKAIRALKDRTGKDDDGTVTLSDIGAWQQDYDAVPGRQVLGTLLSKQDPIASLTSRKVEIADHQVFNHKLSSQLSTITNQKQSGRCWLFAALNMARLAMAKKYNVDDFQFSQAYPMFYDHINKANVFLENMIELADEKLDSRIVQQLISEPVGDGGEWEFAVNLFTRYGLVPQALYPESYSSSSSARMNTLVDSKLREYSFELRKLYKHTKQVVLQSTNKTDIEATRVAISTCRGRKAEQLGEIYTIISLCLGTPPSPTEKFSYEFYDKKGQYHSLKMSPLELLADLGPVFQPTETVSLVNQPNHELGKLYRMERAQNVWGGRECLYVNCDIENLEQTVIKMIKADEPVWFACDAGARGDRTKGIWDVDVADIEGAFGTKLGMNKAERLDCGDSSPTHAMMISGVHVEKGKPVRYRIENSWGPEYGDKGYFLCTAEWFREFTYEIIVPRKLAPPECVKILDAGNPVTLPPWSTMRKKPAKF